MDIETRTIARVTARLVPFLIVCYFIAYLDRVNVGFAALTMNADLGISASAYGLGAGIFFLTYFVFEVPSNLFLERFGARRWIARIMFSWGLLSGATAFIPNLAAATGLSNVTVFYIIRLLLGAAEAGFFPGIIFYLTLWFPSAYRARITGYFMAAIPLSTVIGAPVSGALLGLDGLMGLRGWQWMFILEALPAILLAFAVLAYLTDRPIEARWLEPEGRLWLDDRLEQERLQRVSAKHYSVREALLNPRVLGLGLVYFGGVACLYGVGFFLPQIVKGFGLTNLQTGFVTAIPYGVGTLAMVYWGRRSDRMGERKWHCAIALALAAGGIAASTVLPDPALKMLALSVSACGVFGFLPVFWALPTAFLSGAAAAGGIAIINSIGNLSGFAGPYVMGYLREQTGGFGAGLWCLAVCGAVALAIVLALGHDTTLERTPDGRVRAAE